MTYVGLCVILAKAVFDTAHLTYEINVLTTKL